jgi:small-conductance mechanosensitive channel
MTEQLRLIIETWGPPLLTLLVGTFIGWLFKRFLHRRLLKIAGKTRWRVDDIILEKLEPYILIWFFLAAFNLATRSINIAAPYNAYVAKLALILLILSVSIALSNILVGIMKLWSERQESGFPSTAIFTNLIRIVIIAIGVMIILDSLDISITPILTALGVGGLAVSLALKDTLSDFFSGLHILLSQKVKPGDFVELDSGERGYVTNITWRNTSLLERTNNVISIPNSRLSAAIVRNYDAREPSFSVRVTVGVAYDSDLEHVKAVTSEVARSVMREVEGGIPDFDPPVRFFEFGSSSINLKVYFRVRRYGDQHLVIHEFITRLHRRFEEEGIEIPFPIRTVIQKSPKA